MLKDMYSVIGDCTKLCDNLIRKIEELETKISWSEVIFVDDYVYYADKDIFERGLCLPSDNKMTAEEQAKIIEIVRSCFE
jgi:dTDP-4-amino-4,6-dideoxygalactose transaminase